MLSGVWQKKVQLSFGFEPGQTVLYFEIPTTIPPELYNSLAITTILPRRILYTAAKLFGQSLRFQTLGDFYKWKKVCSVSVINQMLWRPVGRPYCLMYGVNPWLGMCVAVSLCSILMLFSPMRGSQAVLNRLKMAKIYLSIWPKLLSLFGKILTRLRVSRTLQHFRKLLWNLVWGNLASLSLNCIWQKMVQLSVGFEPAQTVLQ